MRALACATCGIALLALPPSALAQTWSPSVNQRMTPPTSHADDYLGVSLSQLIMALGLTLGGPPPPGLDNLPPGRPRQTAAAPAPLGRKTPTGATASSATPVLPAAVERPVKSPEGKSPEGKSPEGKSPETP